MTRACIALLPNMNGTCATYNCRGHGWSGQDILHQLHTHGAVDCLGQDEAGRQAPACDSQGCVVPWQQQWPWWLRWKGGRVEATHTDAGTHLDWPQYDHIEVPDDEVLGQLRQRLRGAQFDELQGHKVAVGRGAGECHRRVLSCCSGQPLPQVTRGMPHELMDVRSIISILLCDHSQSRVLHCCSGLLSPPGTPCMVLLAWCTYCLLHARCMYYQLHVPARQQAHLLHVPAHQLPPAV